MPAPSAAHEAWPLVPPPGAVFQMTRLPSVGNLVVPELVFAKGEEAIVLAWLRGELARWEHNYNLTRGTEPPLAVAPPPTPAEAPGSSEPTKPVPGAIRPLAPPMALDVKRAVPTPTQPQPTVTQTAVTPSGFLAGAAPPVPADRVCKRQDCGLPMAQHEPTQPFPSIRSGCGGFLP